MPSVLSNYYGNLALNLLRRGHWLALHEAAPDVTGVPANEIAGGGYERQSITFSAPSGKSFVSVNRQAFAGMPADLVTDMAIWDAIAGGNLCVIIHLSPAIRVPESGQFLVEASDIAVLL